MVHFNCKNVLFLRILYNKTVKIGIFLLFCTKTNVYFSFQELGKSLTFLAISFLFFLPLVK